ncbi:MAG TPA: hypothetical protein VIK72_08505 [Clostridiaceae bacterium]
MNKWKDTARTSNDIIRKYSGGVKTVFSKNALVIIEKDLSEGLFLVWDSNPKKIERRHYKLKMSEIIIEDYSNTRDINVQMLLADGWDAQDLLRKQQ